MRCWVKSRNERNPCCVLPSFGWALTRDRRRQAGGRWGRRQVIMPLMSWAAHVLQWPAQRARHCASRSKSLKAGPSSDRRLQPASVKSELLVIADQHAAVNTFPGLVHTARHTMRVCNTQSRWDNLYRSQPSKVGQMIRVKS